MMCFLLNLGPLNLGTWYDFIKDVFLKRICFISLKSRPLESRNMIWLHQGFFWKRICFICSLKSRPLDSRNMIWLHQGCFLKKGSDSFLLNLGPLKLGYSSRHSEAVLFHLFLLNLGPLNLGTWYAFNKDFFLPGICCTSLKSRPLEPRIFLKAFWNGSVSFVSLKSRPLESRNMIWLHQGFFLRDLFHLFLLNISPLILGYSSRHSGTVLLHLFLLNLGPLNLGTWHDFIKEFVFLKRDLFHLFLLNLGPLNLGTWQISMATCLMKCTPTEAETRDLQASGSSTELKSTTAPDATLLHRSGLFWLLQQEFLNHKQTDTNSAEHTHQDRNGCFSKMCPTESDALESHSNASSRPLASRSPLRT